MSSINPLVSQLKKPPKDFTKEDLIKFVKNNGIKILNLCHVAEDCRFKTLSFVMDDEKHLSEILEKGERVDGSSLFSYIDPVKSDIYILPRYATAFVNPFNTIPTLNILCSYLDENGKPLDIAPETILYKAEQKLLKNTKISLRVAGELEFYVIYKRLEETLYPNVSQRNYHESAPFVKFEALRNEAIVTLATMGIAVKYAHAEVGAIPCFNEWGAEQHEIEFQPKPPKEMADTIILAKWVLRNIGAKYGVIISFAPKIAVDHAGNGMHIHICALKSGKNLIFSARDKVSQEALKMIGGLLKFAPSLTAWGNTIPTSYLRLVPRQEAPTHICWGYRNREALIRIPLSWSFKHNLAKLTSTKEGRKENFLFDACAQTFELRSPDASANPYLLFASILLAVEYGLTHDDSIKIAERHYVEGKKLFKHASLPTSCVESASHLEKDRKYYEADGIFPERVIDKTIEKLKQFKNEKAKTEELTIKYLHSG